MSNMTNVFGEISINTETPEVLDILLKMFKNCEDGDYCTFLNVTEEGRLSPTTFESNFEGSGRNSYCVNIDKFVKWNETILNKEEKSILKNNHWKINYQYKDWDFEQDLFEIADIDCIHYKNDEYDKLLIATNKCDWPKLTIVNLISNGCYKDLDDYIDREKEYIVDNDQYDFEDEPFIDEIDYNKESLLDYYGCSFKELKERFPQFKKALNNCGYKD